MRLSLRVEFVDSDMTRQCKDLETLWSFTILHFCCIPTSIFMSSKNVPQIFTILLQTGAINVFVLRGVLFDTYAQLKSSFSGEKTSVVKSETYFSREAVEN